MISKKTSAPCPRCGKPLWTSDVEGYKYVCFDCDENFYGIEVKESKTDGSNMYFSVNEMKEE